MEINLDLWTLSLALYFILTFFKKINMGISLLQVSLEIIDDIDWQLYGMFDKMTQIPIFSTESYFRIFSKMLIKE